jgi:hypothetical protein
VVYKGLFDGETSTILGKDILDAIEQNKLSLYRIVGDREHNAVDCLISIYDELAKEEPKEDFIEQTIERLKEYLY